MFPGCRNSLQGKTGVRRPCAGWKAPGKHAALFREQVTEQGVSFDYRLYDGPSITRNAIALLDTMGFGQSTIQRARELAACFDKTGTWPGGTSR